MSSLRLYLNFILALARVVLNTINIREYKISFSKKIMELYGMVRLC